MKKTGIVAVTLAVLGTLCWVIVKFVKEIQRLDKIMEGQFKRDY